MIGLNLAEAACSVYAVSIRKQNENSLNPYPFHAVTPLPTRQPLQPGVQQPRSSDAAGGLAMTAGF